MIKTQFHRDKFLHVFTLLKNQYNLIRGSREVMLNFIDSEVGADLNTPLDVFGEKTVRYLLTHTANTYLHWLACFALKQDITFTDDIHLTSIELIRPLYREADGIMETFLDLYAGRLDEPIAGTLSRNRHVTATPLQLFTHVITHEFHHKGQAMTMCRLLGYTPPDTDVIRF